MVSQSAARRVSRRATRASLGVVAQRGVQVQRIHMHVDVHMRISVCAFPTDAANAAGALAARPRETAVRIEQRCNALVLES